MYAYLFFGTFSLGIFSVIENIKGGQRISILKANILLLLIFISLGALSYFFDELGYNTRIFSSFFRLIGTIFFVNVFFIIAKNKIPKTVVYVECLFFCIYAFMFFYGYSFLTVKDGVAENISFKYFQLFNLIFINLIIWASLLYCLLLIHSNVDRNNLYQFKVLKWSNFLLLLIIFLPLVAILSMLSFNKVFVLFNPDSRIVTFGVYFILLLFILLRPAFIDEVDFSYPKLLRSSRKDLILTRDFDFLFYSSFYFLQKDANLEDFSLKLNHDKSAVLEYLNSHINESFNALVNRNRVKYFRSLLDAKKHESFTLEALSEMSGFNNRQSMYNAFNKHVGCTPSAYINNLK
jgi:AraC-like DNA-binding protein